MSLVLFVLALRSLEQLSVALPPSGAEIRLDAGVRALPTGYRRASEPFGARHDEISAAEVLDVRRAGMLKKAEALIPGARALARPHCGQYVGPNVSRGKEIVVYCMYGHEVWDDQPHSACDPKVSTLASCAAESTAGKQRDARSSPRRSRRERGRWFEDR